MATMSELHESIKASAKALGLKHSRIHQEVVDGQALVDLTYRDVNGYPILYVGIADTDMSVMELLNDMSSLLKLDILERGN